MGHVSFAYLDDGLSSLPDNCSAQAASIIQRKDLGSSGFVVNEDKSCWSPRQIGKWVGFVINTILMKFQVPDKKVAKLKTILDSAIQDGFVTFRNLDKIAGSVNSIYLAVGPIALLLTRQRYAAIDSRSAWDSILPISSSWW